MLTAACTSPPVATKACLLASSSLIPMLRSCSKPFCGMNRCDGNSREMKRERFVFSSHWNKSFTFFCLLQTQIAVLLIIVQISHRPQSKQPLCCIDGYGSQRQRNEKKTTFRTCNHIAKSQQFYTHWHNHRFQTILLRTRDQQYISKTSLCTHGRLHTILTCRRAPPSRKPCA